ncbi:DnaA ATPase domain-containing protein [Staphylococcus epidermidis]|uniref:DnaA ATPase domain-containing protein n=1 Tax=Staphylococcus epidermidis TaxID=1282 RepID=UPI001642CDC5|nr:DnaA/Hda family protein [Staphylococcus epidermidis]
MENRLDRFVIGGGKGLGDAASLGVAEGGGEGYNGLFIYGGVGVGKRDLMDGIGEDVVRKKGNGKVI